MDPQTALDAQIERSPQMTGEERLALGLRWHEPACDATPEGNRDRFPRFDEETAERERRRIMLSRTL